MNLDTLTYSDAIQQAVKRVALSERAGSWVLLGYKNKVKRSAIMTVDVKEEGAIWSELLDSFEDNQIQYAYAKLDLEARGNMKLFLIHWIGKDVEENYKLSCLPHLTEIRNLTHPYDLLVNAMEVTDLQAEVHNFLCRNKTEYSRDFKSCNSMNQKEESLGGSTQERRSRRRAYTAVREEAPVVRSRGGSLSHTPVLAPARKLPKIKVVIIGELGVGKTYIYKSYNMGGLNLSAHVAAKSTLIDCMNKDVSLGKHNFTLEMWDTAGQERFDAFTPTWSRNAKVVICVYDIADELSYQAIPKHMQKAQLYADPKAIFVLVGNKADLVHRREVEKAEGERFSTQHNMTFMECSGLTGYNISNLFESITRHVVFVFEDVLTFTDPSLSSDRGIQLMSIETCGRPRPSPIVICRCL